MASLDRDRNLTFVFELANLPDELHTGELDRGYRVLEVAMWLGWEDAPVYAYSGEFPFKFQDTTSVKRLNHEHWIQLQMIQNLPATAIYDYLKDL